MKKGITGRAGTNSRGKGVITEISIEGTLHPGMTAREGGHEIIEMKAVEASLALPKKE